MRLLGIDPNPRGLGYAVLESPYKLVDWGVKYLPRKKPGESSMPIKARHEKCLRIVENLIEFFDPDVIVFENWRAKDSVRAVEVKKLLCRIGMLVSTRKIASYLYSRSALYGALAEYDVKTKHDMAVFFGRLFPELLPKVPRKRKAWMSENVWLSMFKAVALCFVRGEKLS
jgi:Holliday junction resolvasome RuvABC endonuclease subunit